MAYMERNNVFCPFACGEEPYQEGTGTNEEKGSQFDSKIIRDNEYELSFKYIASPLKSNALPDVHELARPSLEGLGGTYDVKTRRCLSLELPMLKKEGSNNFENYSSFSQSPSRVNSDSEFDFPSPSEESIRTTKPSDFYFKRQVSKGPHQQEWQDADADDNSKMATDQESNNSFASGIEIVGKIVSAVEAQAKLKGKETAGDNFSIKQDFIIAGVLDNSKTTTGVYSHVQSEKTSEVESLTKGRLAHESGVLVSSTISVLRECDSKGSLVPSVSNKNESQLSESIATDADKNLQLKPSSILRKDSKLLGAYPSTSTSLSTGRMKARSTVDTLDDFKRDEGPMAMPSAAYGEYTANHYSDLRKAVKLNGGQTSSSSEQLRVSQKGSKSECHYAWDDFHDKGQLHTRIEVLDMADPKQHCKRNNSSYAEPSHDSKDMHNNHYQESVQDADLYPPPQRSSERSFGTNKRCARADEILADSSFQAQTCQADLYPVGYTDNNVGASDAFPAGSYCNGPDAPFIGSRSSGNTACSSQASACPFMLPFSMHSHPFSHGIYHSVCPVCMPHFHGQGLFFPPLPVPSCLHCSRIMDHYQGHPDLGYHNCGFHVEGPCMFCHSSKCCSSQCAGVHDTSLTKASRSPVNKPKKYPPLPQERMAPYVVCRGCNDILGVPVSFSFGGGVQKLRCGACGTISKFSVHKNSLKFQSVDLQPSPEQAASKSSPLSFEIMAKRREQTVQDLSQRKESSNDNRLFEQSKRCSVSSTGGLHDLQDEVTLNVKPSQDGHDANLSNGRNIRSSQDGFASARSLFSGFKTLSSRFEVKNVRNDDISLQCVVDEKEEGLDFGAPRPSEEEFLDQKSGKFDSMDQPMQKQSFREDEAHASEIQPESQSDYKTACPIRSRLTLYTLFNQESTKFGIAFEIGDPMRESTYGLLSPALKSPVHKCRNQKASSREKKTAPLNLRTEHLIRKGPRQIAAMLTRSWKHGVRI